jgi:hypothetical protein
VFSNEFDPAPMRRCRIAALHAAAITLAVDNAQLGLANIFVRSRRMLFETAGKVLTEVFTETTID